ncbi:MAG: YfcC family protein [Bacteroidales bacterium]
MRKFPHTYVLIFLLVILAAITTWFVPAGEYSRKTIDTGGSVTQVIDAHSFTRVDQQPQTWQVFSAFYKGFIRSPKIIVFILILGGAFWLMNESKAIDTGVYSFIKKSRKLEKYYLIRKFGVNNIIITAVMLMFSFFGAVFGMSEETIAFVAIFVPLAITMGYDSIVGVCMCFIGAGIGFAGCMLNPFTLGIAQEIAGIPLFSGIEYRFVIWMIINVVGIGYVLRYASRVKKNPSLSIVYEEDHYWRTHHMTTVEPNRTPASRSTWWVFIGLQAVMILFAIQYPMNTILLGSYSFQTPMLPVFAVLFGLTSVYTIRKSMEFFVLNILMFTIFFLVGGVIAFGWGLLEIASLFFAMAVASGIAMNMDPSTISKMFIAGAKDILSAALVVGLAGGIIVILEDGKVIDTLLYAIARSMEGTAQVTTLTLMYVFQSALNMIITSGTAKAALIMPILRDISDMIHLSKQATVTAFHIGDGFTNLITPTSGVLIGVLEVARIPFHKWFRWAWKFILILVILGWILLIPTVTMSLNGF